MQKMESSEYTKHYIALALFKLMEKMDFKDITITEIVKKAGVGRATFYRNFPDKEAVLLYYFDRQKHLFSANVRYIPRCDEDYYTLILTVLRTLEKHKTLFQTIQRSHLEYWYLEYLNANFAANFESKESPQNPFLPFAYAGALYNISMEWIRGDCRVPAETAAQALFISIFGKEKLDVLLKERQP